MIFFTLISTSFFLFDCLLDKPVRLLYLTGPRNLLFLQRKKVLRFNIMLTKSGFADSYENVVVPKLRRTVNRIFRKYGGIVVFRKAGKIDTIFKGLKKEKIRFSRTKKKTTNYSDVKTGYTTIFFLGF